MNIPEYVPTAVKQLIISCLEGDDWEPAGWNNVLQNADQELELKKEQLQLVKDEEDQLIIDEHGVAVNKAREHRKAVAEVVDCYRRLIGDPRMAEAYQRLAKANLNDDHLRLFINIASASNLNYEEYRSRIARIIEIRNTIAVTSEKLAKLLIEASETGYFFWPPQFFSIRSLLEHTDYSASDPAFWPTARRIILGTPFPNEAEYSKINADRGELRDLWKKAPDLHSLLFTVSRAAEEFSPQEDGATGTALQSRQKSKSNNKDYLRAFVHHLQDSPEFKISRDLMHAMAITATVVLNDDELAVTYDDVRKVIMSIRPEAL